MPTRKSDPGPDALDHALALAALGLRVIPIIPGKKHPAVKAWQDAATDDPDTIRNWWTGLYRGHGVGLVMGPQPNGLNLAAIDLDRKPDGSGIDEFHALNNAHRDQPQPLDTWTAVTGTGGRHLIFRVPHGRTVRNQQGGGRKIAPHIDVRGDGGQIVVAPTIHPDTKAPYWWLRAPWDAEPAELVPWLAELVCEPLDAPQAPAATAPTAPASSGGPSIADDLRDGWDWHHELTQAGWTHHHDNGDDSYWTRPGKDRRSGHSAVLHGVDGPLVVFTVDATATGLHRAGKPTPGGDAVSVSPLAFVAGTRHGGDLSAAARTLRAERRVPPVGVDPVTGEIDRPDPGRNLPDEFWRARPELAHIRQAAHHATRSADAVLLATLARLSALIPPTVVLPPIAGGRGSLNFLGGIVARSGAGKSTAVDVARDLIPATRNDVLLDLPPGSGEGLTEMYFELVPEEGPDGKTRKVKRQTKTGALMYLDEGEALAKMGNRDSSTLLPTLRSAWSGQTIGQTNASAETHRVLKSHSYRLAVVVGFQVEYAAALIADQAGGTPQRFVFAWALDPNIPDDQPDDPGPLDVKIPHTIYPYSVVNFADEIANEVRLHALRIQRGETTIDPLDSHRDLVRMKLAALLALLCGRMNVDTADWELAGQIWETSTAVRAFVSERAAASARAAEHSYALKLANRERIVEESAERRALVSGAKSIGRRVHSIGGDCSKRDLMAAPSSRAKKLVSVDDMIAHAAEQGWITTVDGRFFPGESRPA